jgi:uncharacterized Ntn-hydrolase superfamily protein
VAVQSKFFGVGAVVPWVEAGTGAIATQAYANTSLGPRGLELLRQGQSPEDVARQLLDIDPEKQFRQLGIVDAKGRSHNFTGDRCVEWAGALAGDNFSVQGNLLVSQATVEAMARTFRESSGELAERLLAALEAGQHAGGDARGRQSAALCVARKNGGYGGYNDRYVDLRVDDHPNPIAELRRLLDVRSGKDAVSQARQLEHQGRVARAAEILRVAIARNPDRDSVHFELARILLTAGKHEEGRVELSAAVARSPGYDHYHYRAAQILAENGDAARCLEEIEKTLAINSEYAKVFRREVKSPVSVFRPLREKIESLLRS